MDTPEPPPQSPDQPQSQALSPDQPLIERMRATLREQRPEAERAEQPPAAREEPRVARRAPGRRERAQRERRDIARAGEVGRVRKRPERTDEGKPRAEAERDQAEAERESDALTRRLAQHLAELRAEREWSLQDLARRTGVSRSTLSRAEHGEVSPTADVLARLASAYDRTVSALLAEVETQPRSLVRAAEQAVTGEDAWRRRAVSPPYPGLRGSVVDGQLLPGTDVVYTPPVAGVEQHIWLITGSLEITVGADRPRPPSRRGPEGEGLSEILHRHGIDTDVRVDERVDATDDDTMVLIRGDCLRLRLWGPARLRCLSPDPVRYAMFTVAP